MIKYVPMLFLGYYPRLCFFCEIYFLGFALFSFGFCLVGSLVVFSIFLFFFVILVVLLHAGLLDL